MWTDFFIEFPEVGDKILRSQNMNTADKRCYHCHTCVHNLSSFVLARVIKIQLLYSDTSVNEDNSFRNHIR